MAYGLAANGQSMTKAQSTNDQARRAFRWPLAISPRSFRLPPSAFCLPIRPVTIPGMLVHTVLFWLNDSATAAQRQQLLTDCRELLKQVPSVRQIWAGNPVPSSRPVVDGSYDVGLCVIFDDQAGHDAYQVHPTHLKFIERNKPAWKRVQVYDFE